MRAGLRPASSQGRPATPVGMKFKIVLIGEPGTGKTSFFMRVKDNTFGTRPTLGIENCSKEIEINGTTVTYSLWDTAGQERFRTLTTGYFRNCQAVLLIYSVDDMDSMNALAKWNADIEHYARAGVVKVVVGNKSDLENTVSQRRLNDFCDIYQCQLSAQVSAKTGEGINELLETLAQYLIRQMNAGSLNAGAHPREVGRGGSVVHIHDGQDPRKLPSSETTTESRCNPC